MKINRLDLKAFGPFTDRTIALDSKLPGLHIIFGANEAGKSSSLRALKALLYGFPERTSDNFQHANDQLLVAGNIENAKGQQLTFSRRKKRKASLLDINGNPLAANTLAAFLPGVDPTLFESLYGIDHKTLVAGGQDILAQKGEVGQALFAAGTGISSLKKILDTLEAEADELFKDRGSKQQINQAIKEYKELKKSVRDLSLLPSKWKAHHQHLQEAEAEHTRLEEESRLKSVEIRRLERLNKVIPELAVLENLQKQLEELGEVVILAPEFSEQLQKVERDIRETRLRIDNYHDRLRKLQLKQAGIHLNHTLINHAETIEDLHQRLGEYRKGLQDRVRLDGMRITYRIDAGSLLEEIRPDLTLDDISSLRPVLGKRRTIQALGSQHEALIQQAAQAHKQKDMATQEIKKIAAVLSSHPPNKECNNLIKAIKLTQKAGDIDGQIAKISRDLDGDKKSSSSKIKRLGLWPGTLKQLLISPLPLLETVRRFEDDFSELSKEIQQLKKERKRTEIELQSTKTDDKEIVYGGNVPSEQDLEASRQKRQKGWQLLRKQWLGGQVITEEAREYEPDLTLHDAYEKNVERADLIADRLRREAERVAKAASLKARIESLSETIQFIITQENELLRQQKVLNSSWQAEWQTSKIKPLPPREMLSWLTEIDKLQFKSGELLNKENELLDRKKARQQIRAVLADELKELGNNAEFSDPELAPILILAETVLENMVLHKATLEKLSGQQSLAQTARHRAQRNLEETESSLIEWQARWENALTGLRLQEQVLPSEILDRLETIGICIDKLDKAKEFQSRINGIDRDMQKFSIDILALLKKIAGPSDLKTLSADQATLQLHSMLGEARQNSELHKKNSEELEALTLELKNAQKTLQSLDGEMAKLLVTAKSDKSEKLAAAIRKSAESLRLHEKISDANSALAKVSEGIPLAALKLQTETVNVDDLPGQITSLKRQFDQELHPKISESLKLIGEENRELQLMDGSSQAADVAAKMEQVGTKIRRLVEHYSIIKLTIAVLKDEIERYRKEHQDPILKIASKLFSQLTLGSFAGLRTDIDDNGNPNLIGVRTNNSRVAVEGMSDGTCDQLYLALRLATIQERLEHNEPMPLIVDDILINFDDERSQATIKILTELAKLNQVILFTHHQQIVELAKNIDNPGVIKIHNL